MPSEADRQPPSQRSAPAAAEDAKLRLVRAAEWTPNPAQAHQRAAWDWLDSRLKASTLEEFYRRFRAGDESQAPDLGPDGEGIVRLPRSVPYFRQTDNESGQGERECFSSACAMIAAYWGTVRSDDEYCRIRARYGDTTEASAQIAALTALGLWARFTQRASIEWLEGEIRAGRPVAVGWLHRGPSSKPTGGGHWSVAVAYRREGFYLHDPMGEPDVAAGGFVAGKTGRGVLVSRRNWVPRWLVEGPAHGWAISVIGGDARRASAAAAAA